MIDITPYLPGFIAAYSILFVGALSPGPSVAMLIGIATREGRFPALVATLGIMFGSMTICITTLLGVGYALSQAAWVMSMLRIIGAAYLLYLAYGAFKRTWNPPELQPTRINSDSWFKYFIKAYLLQITNPKAIAFWLAIASINSLEGAEAGIIVLFVIGAALISFICHVGLSQYRSIPFGLPIMRHVGR